MTDPVRQILLTAVQAGCHGHAPRADIAGAIANGDQTLKLDALGFDSLAWMEFCISIELQCGQELAPGDIETMDRVGDVEAWLRDRL
jgi:acyl carrier protein